MLSTFLTDKPIGKIPLGRPRRRVEDNIKMDLVFVFVLMGWSLLPNALRPFQIYCAPPNSGFLRPKKSIDLSRV